MKSKLIVTGQVVHQKFNEMPKGWAWAFGQELCDSEQAYERCLQLSTEPVDFSRCWITKASLLLIENVEGRGLQVVPTEEERRDIAKRVVEIHVGNAMLCIVRPGRHMLIPSPELASIRISGTARCTIVVVPE